jgi:copper chaperone|tara:strand:+ start:56980 stop:57180 length:201 start_codon:yes stop_codon:yes gene_type:complete
MMIRFEIPGMTCGGCARSVTTAIQGIDAQAKVEIDIPGKSVCVESRADRNSLIEAIREAGYEARTA